MITIKKSKTADNRYCDFTKVTKTRLLMSSHQHIDDVRKGLSFFTQKIMTAAEVHDRDKITDIDGFHRDFTSGPQGFITEEWWRKHVILNRHHLLVEEGVPGDVNLIDVLDMIADCVMAGMGRTGSVYPLNIKPEVLMAAFHNTVELLKKEVVVRDE